jgi:hypothetical protein
MEYLLPLAIIFMTLIIIYFNNIMWKLIATTKGVPICQMISLDLESNHWLQWTRPSEDAMNSLTPTFCNSDT